MSHPNFVRKCLTTLSDEVWLDLHRLVSKYYLFIRNNIDLIGISVDSKNNEEKFSKVTEIMVRGSSANRLAGRSLRYVRQHSKALLFFKLGQGTRPLRLKDCQNFRMQVDDLCTYFRERGISVLMEETVKFYAEYVEYFNAKGINIDGNIHLEYAAKNKN